MACFRVKVFRASINAEMIDPKEMDTAKYWQAGLPKYCKLCQDEKCFCLRSSGLQFVVHDDRSAIQAVKAPINGQYLDAHTPQLDGRIREEVIFTRRG